MTNNKNNEESFDFSDSEDEEQIRLPTSENVYSAPIEQRKSSSNDVEYHDLFDSSDEDDEDDKVPAKKLPEAALPIVKAAPIRFSTPIEEEAPPFGIVLVNIKKAAEERHIHCEKKRLDGTTPYVALSYRWGELDEQMVPATKDYHARIVSFQLADFYKLCQAMLHEPDLQSIEYVWVDAICVDQDNVEKRKATIYRMNDIYIHAAAIVAVPDLHALHLSASSTANDDAMKLIKKYRRYLYYLLVGTPDAHQALVDMDHAWMDRLGLPTLATERRDLILAAQQQQQQSGLVQQMMTLTTTTHEEEDPHAKAEYYQQLNARLMIALQRQAWEQQLDQRKTDIIQSMKFLRSLMEDWSNRTWVISEYHIAKRKTGKLKFWYNQLSSRELSGYRFFEFDFVKHQDTTTTTTTTPDPYTAHIIQKSRKFMGSMRRRLTKRSVLEMMLQTKASKCEDRFHSIIPLAAKYKHHIKDRNSIASLGISNMLSVRLKLMEWMDTKDRLNLLFCTRQSMSSPAPFLPTFASHFKTIKAGLTSLLTRHPSHCNFDLTANDDQGVRLKRGPLETLWLSPRVYYTPCTRHAQRRRHFYQEMGGKELPLWQALGLDPTKDGLDAVSIPLFLDHMHHHNDDDDTALSNLLKSDLQLVGSWEKNIWLMYPFCSNYKDGKIYPSSTHQHTLPDGFRIY